MIFCDRIQTYFLGVMTKRHGILTAAPRASYYSVSYRPGDFWKIRYEIIKESGPSHDRLFEVELFVGDKSCSMGKGKSKKEAEEEAASIALESIEALEPPNA